MEPAAIFRPRFDPRSVAPLRHGAGLEFQRRLRRTWSAAFGIAEADLDAGADYEDWTENAVQLAAAVERGLPVLVMGDRKTPLAPTAALNGATGRMARERALLLVGSLRAYDPLLPKGVPGNPPLRIAEQDDGIQPLSGLKATWPDVRAMQAAAGYHRTEAFRSLCGRMAALADVEGEFREGDAVRSDDPNALRSLVARMGREGVTRFITKSMLKVKDRPLIAFDVPAGASEGEIDDIVQQTFEWDLIEMEGLREALLLQERLDLVSEYRFLVVDGRPVTGAGCIEHMTPAEHDSGPVFALTGRSGFDSKVEGVRNSGDVRDDPDLAARLLAFADEACERFAAEGLTEMTLDVALDRATGKTVVVEANPLGNAGLYASDYGLMLDAVLASVRQGPKPPEP
jgi:hypothetical protein